MPKFNKKIRKFLKSIAHQPWGIDRFDAIRVKVPKSVFNKTSKNRLILDTVCPICHWGNIQAQEWKYDTLYWTVPNTGLTEVEKDAIASAADYPHDIHREELMKLLGMTK